jgi:uncharacterized protein (DUF924 family)
MVAWESEMKDYQAVLDYWFGDGSDPARRQRELWFAGSARVDADVRRRFLPEVESAERGELDHWRQAPEACLALIVLLDQFPLMIFRGQARGYRDGNLALPVARHLVEHGFDASYTPSQRLFAYLPFEHSEDLADQERALALFGKMRHLPGIASAYDYAVKHWEVVERFGRFPHRNEALGRTSTPEEIKFLKTPGARFGG